MRAALILAGAITLGGCVSTVQEQPPIVHQVAAPYDAFGACAFQILSSDNTATKMADLRAIKTFNVYAEVEWFRQWELSVRETSPGQSTVTIRSLPTIHGPQGLAPSIWQRVQHCGRA